MSPGLFKMLRTNYLFTNHIYFIYLYKQVLTFNNLWGLIWHRIQPTNQPTNQFIYLSIYRSIYLSASFSLIFLFIFSLLLPFPLSFSLSLSLPLSLSIYLSSFIFFPSISWTYLSLFCIFFCFHRYLCVCVWERERESVCVCECVRTRERVCVYSIGHWEDIPSFWIKLKRNPFTDVKNYSKRHLGKLSSMRQSIFDRCKKSKSARCLC